MEEGCGNTRGTNALSVWGGEPAGIADDNFPLENLWKEEMQQIIDAGKIGPRTMNHPDNFYHSPEFLLPFVRGTGWARYAEIFLGVLHIFAEQVTVQMTLHLHQNIKVLCTRGIFLYFLCLEGGRND